MSNRTVTVEVLANVRGALAGLTELQSKTKQTSNEMLKSAQENEQAWNTLGKGFLTVGALAGAGVGLAVAKFMEFDQSMSNVQASTMESADGMSLLRDAALDAGAKTMFSASESANAIDELGKAGLTTKDIVGGALAGSLDLAAAGGLGVARAAEIASTTLSQFNMKGSEAGHVADVLAAGANKALGSVDDLANGLKFVGPVASDMNVSLDETVGTLALFAKQGIIGEQAGTALRGMLSSLTSPSAIARKEIEKLGITLYDQQGKFLGIENAAGQLAGAYEGMTDAQRDMSLGILFGNEQITAARVLYKAGAEGVADMTAAVNDNGFAAEVARIKVDNLAGDVEKLGGSIDTALIKTGSGADGVLRDMTQSVTGLIDGFSNLPAPVQQGVLVVGALTAGVGILGGGFLVIVPKIAAARLAMQSMNITAGSLAGKIGKGGALLAGLGVLTVGLSGMGTVMDLTAEDTAKLDAALKNVNMKALNAEFETGRRGASGLKDSLNQLYTSDFFQSEQGNLNFGKFMANLGVDVFYKDLRKAEAQIQSLGRTLAQTAKTDFPAANEQFQELVRQAGGGKEAARQLLEGMDDYKAVLRELAGDQGKTLSEQELINFALGEGKTAHQVAATAAVEQKDALQEVGAAAGDASGSISELADQLRNFGSATLDSREAQRSFEAAVDDAAAALTENGATLDVTTEKGRANQAALDAIARAANSAAAAIYEETGSETALQGSLAKSRAQLIANGIRFGLTEADAAAYADQVLATPAEVSTAVKLTGIEVARQRLAGLIADYQNRSVTLRAVIHAADQINANGNVHQYANGGLETFAGGGFLSGIYAGRPGGIHKFAEPETGFEAYLSGKPGMERRNIALAYRTIGMLQRQLGGTTPMYASAAMSGGSGGSMTVTEHHYRPTFQVMANPTRPLADQVFDAARRLRKGK